MAFLNVFDSENYDTKASNFIRQRAFIVRNTFLWLSRFLVNGLTTFCQYMNALYVT